MKEVKCANDRFDPKHTIIIQNKEDDLNKVSAKFLPNWVMNLSVRTLICFVDVDFLLSDADLLVHVLSGLGCPATIVERLNHNRQYSLGYLDPSHHFQ